jgi:hypothetical protein
MRYIGASVTAIAVCALAAVAGAQTVQKGSDGSAPREINAEVVMKDAAHYATKGETGPGIMLLTGQQANIRLRNDDTVAHAVMPSMLYNVPFRLTNGVFVQASKAAGVRIDPGQTVEVSFEAPHDGALLILDQRGEKKASEGTTPACHVSVDNC